MDPPASSHTPKTADNVPILPVRVRSKRSKVVVITGGNRGIGLHAALQLYRDGYHIVIGARSQQKNKEAVAKILQQVPTSKGSVVAFQLDLTVKKSIQQFVKSFASHIYKVLRSGKEFNPNMKTHIDILINNAGLFGQEEMQVNESGIELTLATNHFGHFYLTYLLYPYMEFAKNTRIINVSSDMHYKVIQNNSNNNNSEGQNKNENGVYNAKHVFDLDCKEHKYDPFEQYAISKLYNNLFTVELQELFNLKHEDPKFKAVALHPGFVDTTFGSHSQDLLQIKQKYKDHMVSVQVGANSILSLSRRAFIDLKRGQYYDQNGNEKEMSQLSRNQIYTKKLWEISQKVYGIQYH